MADREIKAGDRLVANRNLERGGIKKGDVVIVKTPLLKWPCQNFYAEGHGDREFAHQQFEHVGFQVGDFVRCIEQGYASYKIGDEGQVVEVLSGDTFRLAKTSRGGWHHMKHFELVAAAPGVTCPAKMSEEEWQNNEGWLNEATYHGALCFYNDGKAMQKLDDHLVRCGSLLSTHTMTGYITLPSGRGLRKSDIDVWALQYDRALELYEDGRITQSAWDKLISKVFVSKYSGCCQRRLELLKKAGFDTDDHFFFDYKKGVTPMGSINTFKVGDKVMLISNHMDASDAGTESNGYVKSNNLEHDVVYEVVQAGKDSFKVKSKAFWMNPRQFKLADEATLPMSKEDTMKKLKIETITYVNDTNVTEYDALSQAQMVEKYEAEIARLEAFTTKPKKVVALIEEMKADLAAVVAAFDAVED